MSTIKLCDITALFDIFLETDIKGLTMSYGFVWYLFQPLLGGGDHDQAHMGVFAEFKKKYEKVYKNPAGEFLSVSV